MTRLMRRLTFGLIMSAGAMALAQSVTSSPPANRSLPSCLVVPQSRVYSTTGALVAITSVAVEVSIDEQVARTSMSVRMLNSGAVQAESELLVPVPRGVVVKGFTFEGLADEPTARLLPLDEARQTYSAIVAKMKDPGLLEFAGYQMIRSSLFPIEAGQTQTIRIEYEQVLEADGERIDYVIPRTESLAYTIPWDVTVKIRSETHISTLYSPSHPLDVIREKPGSMVARFTPQARLQPGAFRLSYLLEGNGMAASLFTYPDGPDGGYFLFLAGLPPLSPTETKTVRREVTLVIDRSGSMKGEKIEQARESARQVLEGLEEGESFNIITYSDTVDMFSAEPVQKNAETIVAARAYLQLIQAQGGTNLYDALTRALVMSPTAETLPLTLFLTDGLPTVGMTSELAISKLASTANPYQRRVFTVGVGVDVNTPLLDKISTSSRAKATYVLPGENVEVKVSKLFKRLNGPVLASPKLQFVDAQGNETPARTSDVLPGTLADLFEDDQLVVLGRYRGTDPVSLRLSGEYLGQERSFGFCFELGATTAGNGFVRRLWASRKIASLVDAIRDLGASGQFAATASQSPGSAAEDPRLKELVDAVVALSTEHGVLTEYTAFLALEGTDLNDNGRVLAEANANFFDRAVSCRSGLAGVNQDFNAQQLRGQSCLNFRNDFYDATMKQVGVGGVQQLNDRAFFRRSQRWVDSRLVTNEDDLTPTREIHFGSEQYRELTDLLLSRGREGCLSLIGDILLQVDGEAVLIRGALANPSERDSSKTGSLDDMKPPLPTTDDGC